MGRQDLAERRRRAVGLVKGGMTLAQAGAMVGLDRKTVGRAVKHYVARGGGPVVLSRAGRPPHLTQAQHTMLTAIVAQGRPDQVGLDGHYWTRATAAALVERETGRRVSEATAGRYLNEWGAERLRGRPPRN